MGRDGGGVGRRSPALTDPPPGQWSSADDDEPLFMATSASGQRLSGQKEEAKSQVRTAVGLASALYCYKRLISLTDTRSCRPSGTGSAHIRTLPT